MLALASAPADDQKRALAAEVEATLRLSWIGQVTRVRETRGPSVDFQVDGVNVEVSCPQEHREERRVVEADLVQQERSQTGAVGVAISIGHLWTGSGRSVDGAGNISRDPTNCALEFPGNKLIDRLLQKKRDGRQFKESEYNVLWLDLKHGLGMRAIDCIPFRSEVVKGTCFVGACGTWNAFYGEIGSPLLPERTTLEFAAPVKTYQQQKNGWFREMPKISAAVLSVLDGTLLFENPWADVPFDVKMRERFARLSEFRPEVSWFGPALGKDVASVIDKISWLATIVRATSAEPDGSA